MQLRIDMHVHSYFSADSSISPKELVFYARQKGLNGVAITDHDRLDGAKRIARGTDFLIIPGIEVASTQGHIVGLNISELVSSKLTPHETVEKIHDAGGLAVACHPFGLFKGGLGNLTDSRFDAVEVINSSAIPFGYSTNQNMRIATRLGKPSVAGSDAHYGPEIGCAFTVIETEPNPDAVVKAIDKGFCQPFGKATPLQIRLKRMIENNKRKFKFASKKREEK